MARPKAAPVTPAPARTKPMLAVVSTALSVSVTQSWKRTCASAANAEVIIMMLWPNSEIATPRIGQTSAWIPYAAAIGPASAQSIAATAALTKNLSRRLSASTFLLCIRNSSLESTPAR